MEIFLDKLKIHFEDSFITSIILFNYYLNKIMAFKNELSLRCTKYSGKKIVDIELFEVPYS